MNQKNKATITANPAKTANTIATLRLGPCLPETVDCVEVPTGASALELESTAVLDV